MHTLDTGLVRLEYPEFLKLVEEPSASAAHDTLEYFLENESGESTMTLSIARTESKEGRDLAATRNLVMKQLTAFAYADDDTTVVFDGIWHNDPHSRLFIAESVIGPRNVRIFSFHFSTRLMDIFFHIEFVSSGRYEDYRHSLDGLLKSIQISPDSSDKMTDESEDLVADSKCVSPLRNTSDNDIESALPTELLYLTGAIGRLLQEDADLIHTGEFDSTLLLESIGHKYAVICSASSRQEELDADITRLKQTAEALAATNPEVSRVLITVCGFLLGMQSEILSMGPKKQ